jgi:glycosyltransferase involved in cell wall biosynthesis
MKKILVTGDALFLRRHKPLFEEMAKECKDLNYLIGDQRFEIGILNQAAKILNKLIYLASPLSANRLQKNIKTFISKSKRVERKIRQLSDRPDYVLHVFSMYCPFWDQFDIPYGILLDYTMSLVKKNWTPWSSFTNEQEFREWIECERLAYQRSHHLFAMSELVKSSLINDYGIAPEKITVIGSFASRHPLYEGEKSFGSQQILFNGAEFERKGGDIVLAAFQQVKEVLPEAKLVIIGKNAKNLPNGAENRGRIASLEAMRQLFLETDLVVAPARCDPFPSFVIEAMNYGVPCIVSGNDGMPEIVDDGINGLVVDPLTPELLAEKIISLLGDRAKLNSMSARSRQKVKTQFNCQAIAKKVMQALSAK